MFSLLCFILVIVYYADAFSSRFGRTVTNRVTGVTTVTMGLVPAKTAIVFIEYQNEFAAEGGKLYEAVKPCMEATNMLSNSREVMDAARAKGVKIFHAPIKFRDNFAEVNGNHGILANVKGGECFKASTWGADFIESMTPAPEDIIVDGKRGLCGFASTNLDFMLRQNGIENVVLAGFLTNCCVESTMRSAYEKGYNVVTLTDCAAATSLEAQKAAFEFNFPMFSKPQTSKEFLETIE